MKRGKYKTKKLPEKFKREYESWSRMKQRCNNPKTPGYKYYGGKGISYPDRWSSFEEFLRDMGPRPQGTTLDRIDVNKNYSKENCRWATYKEQANNRNNNVTYKGKTISEWCILLDLNRATVFTRLHRGWSKEEALYGRTK